MKFIFSIFLLMVFPLSSAYYEALRLAQLPKKQHVILGAIAILVTVTSAFFSFTMIGQIDANSFSSLNLIPALVSFFMGRTIRRKFPAIFLKALLQNNTENSK